MKDDGGPAFPVYTADMPVTGSPGMTLRDWFAGNAREEDVVEYVPQPMGEYHDFEKEHGFPPTREWAKYQYADAMLKAREAGDD